MSLLGPLGPLFGRPPLVPPTVNPSPFAPPGCTCHLCPARHWHNMEAAHAQSSMMNGFGLGVLNDLSALTTPLFGPPPKHDTRCSQCNATYKYPGMADMASAPTVRNGCPDCGADSTMFGEKIDAADQR